MKIPRRSLVTGTVALGALAAMRERAEAANVPFTTFAFTATGEPTARTMPVRLAEIKNVMDFGAIGDDSHNDTTNIQAAVNAAISAGGGTIYFPLGSYKITAPITFNTANISLCFRGEGDGTFIDAKSFSAGGFAFDRSLGSPSNTAQVVIEKMSIGADASSAGAVRLGSCNSIAVRDCKLGGEIGITTEDSPGNSSTGILIENVTIPVAVTTGIIMGGSGAILGCGFKACDVGIRLYGQGALISGCRLENCNTCYVLGLDGGTAATLTGATVSGNTLSFSSAIGTVAIGQELSDGGVNVTPGITILSGSGTTWTISNPALTISTPQAMTTIGNDRGASGFMISGGTTEGNWTTIDLAGTCSGFYIGSIEGLGHDKTNAGATPNIQNTQYGILVRANKASGGVFSGLSHAGWADIAAAEIDAATSRVNLLFLGCQMLFQNGTGVNWIMPSNAYTAQFQNCNTSGVYPNGPIWTYSQLPQTTNAFEGDEFSISDSTTNTWGQTVAGSGSDHVWVRYNNSVYTVVAK